MPRWPSAGAVSLALLPVFRLEGRTQFQDNLVKEDAVEVS